MNFIKRFDDKKKVEITLCNYLQTKLEYKSPARSPTHVHASDLTKEDPEMCPREFVILRAMQVTRKDDHHGVATRVAFAIGEAYHDLIRNDWLRGVAVGHWDCAHCKIRIPFSKEPHSKCPRCGGTVWNYEEVRFNSLEMDISGSIDLIADLGLPKHVIVEIKSMDKDQFAELIAPLAEHRIRTSLYLRIIEGSDSPYKDRIDLTHARIIYVSKGYGKKGEDGKFSPFKEYVITRNDDAIEDYVEKAKMVKLYEDTGMIPYGVCKNTFVGRVKKCHCSKACFTPGFEAGTIYLPKKLSIDKALQNLKPESYDHLRN